MITTMSIMTTATTTKSTTCRKTTVTSSSTSCTFRFVLSGLLLVLVIISFIVLPVFCTTLDRSTSTSTGNTVTTSTVIITNKTDTTSATSNTITSTDNSNIHYHYDLLDKKEEQQLQLQLQEEEERILQQVETTGTAITNKTVIQLTIDAFKSYIDSNYFDVIIDVRDEVEWTTTGHIPNATLIPNLASYNSNSTTSNSEFALYDTILQSKQCQTNNCLVVVYCNSGRRASDAIIILQQYYNWTSTQFYNGLGVSQWSAAGYELVNTPSITTPYCSIVLSNNTSSNNTSSNTCPRKIDTSSNITIPNDSTIDRCNPNITSSTKERCIPTNETISAPQPNTTSTSTGGTTTGVNSTNTTTGSGSSSSSTVVNPTIGTNYFYSILLLVPILLSSVAII